MKHKLATLLSVFFLILKIDAQAYLDDRTMKLTEISTERSYGYDSHNPIKVGNKQGADGAYLNALKYPGAKSLHIKDMKFNFNGKMGLEMVELSLEGLSEIKTLYILTTEFDNPKVPMDFTFKTAEDLPKVVRFPEDSIKKVKTCAEEIYAVQDFMLQRKLGELPVPSSSPTYKGGLDSLKKFLDSFSLREEKGKQSIFQVAIAFMITCNDQAGNFMIVTQGRGDLETYANEVLAFLNNMPQNWVAAQKKGVAVDCYQILSFTVSNGKLTMTSYR